MGANPKYESHFVDLYLPPATIVPVEILILGYTLLLLLDYVLIKNDEKIARVISPKLLRFIIATYHFLVPIFFASKYDFGNISFMIHPWTTAAQIVFLTKSDMSFGDWIPFVIKVATFQDDSPTTDTPREIRLKGLQKVARGIAKFAFMKVALDGILPEDLSDLLALPFYSPKAMFITYVLALRIYCMLSTVDIIMGFTQAVFLIRFNDLFDNPFLATSPKDFWSRRWNRAVSRLFHQVIFTKAITHSNEKKNDDKAVQSTSTSYFSARTTYGLLIFFISGVIHDLMITAATRNITFEMTIFFMIHGVVATLEANFRTGKYKQDPTGVTWLFCNMLTVLFFVTTGRVFLTPILKHDTFLRIAQQF